MKDDVQLHFEVAQRLSNLRRNYRAWTEQDRARIGQLERFVQQVAGSDSTFAAEAAQVLADADAAVSAELLDRWASWALTHLPGTAADYLAKAKQEWDEFLRGDMDPEEAADVIMCVAAVVAAQGTSPSGAVSDKFAVNRERTWEPQPDGTFQHVR